MLCTYIKEKYQLSEAADVALALEDIASPKDNYGWSSAGVYCFWDTETNEILYIGLAVDLSLRFRQHNGLATYRDENCKYKQITEWFNNREEIGYSIFVQSCWGQPINSRYNKANNFVADDPREKLAMKEGHEAIINVEGLLLKSYLIAKGKLPRWNKIGGSVHGARKATGGHVGLIELFTDSHIDYCVAVKTIRELSANPEFEHFENLLHGIRLRAILFQKPFKEIWDCEKDAYGLKERIAKCNYLPAHYFL